MEQVPAISFTDFIFRDFEEKTAGFKDRPWIIDIPSDRSITFGQVKGDAIKIASALEKLGFKHGDVLYFVTFEAAHLFLVKIAVWMLGGVVRGCGQQELPHVYVEQMKESTIKFVLVDSETIHVMQPALDMLQYDGCILSLGDEHIQGATHISKLLVDNGSVSDLKTNINPREDALVILNTSGSTGNPKGVVHTHFSAVAMMTAPRDLPMEDSLLEFMINYGVGLFAFAMHFLNTGRTLYHINKFKRETFFNYLEAYHPNSLMIYPRVANWFARCNDQLEKLAEANFIKMIFIGGWVLDPTTADLLHDRLPNTHLQQIYGMTEIGFSSATKKGLHPSKLDRCESEGLVLTSSGMLLPTCEGKIVGLHNNEIVGPYKLGELYLRSPSIAKGYLTSGGKVEKLTDEEGWFQTGDVAIQDERGNFFIKERVKFMYKYLGAFVLPSEIETVLLEHPSVQETGVVGMPDPYTDSASRAFVVIKKGAKCSEEELCKFVAERLPFRKHLHGGVRFVETLPMNKGGKLDRKELKQIALKNNQTIAPL